MSKTFKIGEKAVIVSDGPFKGEVVTIQDRLQLCHGRKGNSWFGYPTTTITPEGLQLCPAPHDLERIQPHGGPVTDEKIELSNWGNVGWNPHKSPQVTA